MLLDIARAIIQFDKHCSYAEQTLIRIHPHWLPKFDNTKRSSKYCLGYQLMFQLNLAQTKRAINA